MPRDEDSGPDKTAPASFVVLNAEHVLAFLDILPMTRGHLLVTVREHREKVEDLRGGEAGDIGMFVFFLFVNSSERRMQHGTKREIGSLR